MRQTNKTGELVQNMVSFKTVGNRKYLWENRASFCMSRAIVIYSRMSSLTTSCHWSLGRAPEITRLYPNAHQVPSWTCLRRMLEWARTSYSEEHINPAAKMNEAARTAMFSHARQGYAGRRKSGAGSSLRANNGLSKHRQASRWLLKAYMSDTL